MSTKHTPAPPTPVAPKLVYPDGYCLDPDGRMCVPYGRKVDWDFGYEIGFREAMDFKTDLVEKIQMEAYAEGRKDEGDVWKAAVKQVEAE